MEVWAAVFTLWPQTRVRLNRKTVNISFKVNKAEIDRQRDDDPGIRKTTGECREKGKRMTSMWSNWYAMRSHHQDLQMILINIFKSSLLPLLPHFPSIAIISASLQVKKTISRNYWLEKYVVRISSKIKSGKWRGVGERQIIDKKQLPEYRLFDFRGFRLQAYFGLKCELFK